MLQARSARRNDSKRHAICVPSGDYQLIDNAKMASFPYHQDVSQLPSGYRVDSSMASKVTESARTLPGGQNLFFGQRGTGIITSDSGLVAYVIYGSDTYNLVFGGTTSGGAAGTLTQRSFANFGKTMSQWGANFKNGLGGLPKCYAEAELLLVSLIKHAGLNVSACGHSLGGAMATYAAARQSSGHFQIAATGYCSAELGTAAVKAINADRGEAGVADAISKIQHILINGDPVSSIGRIVPNLQHVGEVSKIDHAPGMRNPVEIHDQFMSSVIMSSVSIHFS